MEMIDMKKLTPEAKQERRRAGFTYEAIAADLGLSRTGVFDICKRFDAGGAKALADKPCGRPVGVLRALSEEQERDIRRLVIDDTPDQLKMDFALWTRQAVLLLIEQRCGRCALTVPGRGPVPAPLGLHTTKRQRAYEQQPAAVRRWLTEHYRALSKEPRPKVRKFTGPMKPVCARMMCADAAAPDGPDTRGPSQQRREGPVHHLQRHQPGQGALQGLRGAMTAAILIDFMKRLVQEAKKDKGGQGVPGAGQPEGASARVVKAWLQENKEHMEVFYLPSYSPELNPDEMLNANLKAAVTTKAPNRRKGQLKAAAIGHLRHLQKSPAKVKQFFQKESVKYAA